MSIFRYWFERRPILVNDKNLFIQFISSSTKSPREFDDHGSAVIVFFFSVSLQYTYTYKFLIEISSIVARTHLTDAHQMHVIHLNSGSDYTSHSILLFFSTIYRVLSCYTHIYPFIRRRISLIVTMTRWNFLRAWYEKKNLHRWSVK